MKTRKLRAGSISRSTTVVRQEEDIVQRLVRRDIQAPISFFDFSEVDISSAAAPLVEVPSSRIPTQNITIHPGRQINSVRITRIDNIDFPNTTPSYENDLLVGDHFSNHETMARIAEGIDNGLLAMVDLRSRIETTTSRSVLRLDTMVRFIYPTNYPQLSRCIIERVITTIARSLYGEFPRNLIGLPIDGQCDRLVHRFISMVAAGHWGSF